VVKVLQLSGGRGAKSADRAGAYERAPIIKVKATGQAKNRKPATTKRGVPVALASAAYSASNNSVALTPRGKLTAAEPEELIVNGALVTDALGRPIDGNDDGQSGGDYIATVSGSRVTLGGAALGNTGRRERVIAGDHGFRHFGCDRACGRAAAYVLHDLFLGIPVQSVDAAGEIRQVMFGGKDLHNERRCHQVDFRISRKWAFLARFMAGDNAGGSSSRSTKRR
jgi:hypothetical protein